MEINVQDFLSKHQHLAELYPRYWEELMEAQITINNKFADKNIANDILGKVILGHCVGEEIALAFKRHINKYFVCEEDRKRGCVPVDELEVAPEISEEAA